MAAFPAFIEQKSARTNTRIVSSLSNSSDYFLSRIVIRQRIGDEHGNRQPPSIRQSDQSDVVGRMRQTVVHVGRTRLMRHACSRRKVAFQPACLYRPLHPAQEQLRMIG